ncbi:MAG: hypothetical protein HS113_12920 [Verrucomicrobiales bacterium]|nr:hypothetical protein [Verrucomicrobiales bacterium]
MKRNLVIVGGCLAAIVLLGTVLDMVFRPDTRPINLAKVLAASERYRGELEAAGQPVPQTVSLGALLERGWLRTEDLPGFAGLEVEVALQPDPARPQDVLMRARFPDGDELVALADGSVQRVKPGLRPGAERPAPTTSEERRRY